MIGQKYSGGVWKVAGFILVRPLITLTFSLQSFGCQFLGQFHKLAVFLSDILILCIQVLPFFVALLRLIKETIKTNNEYKVITGLSTTYCCAFSLKTSQAKFANCFYICVRDF